MNVSRSTTLLIAAAVVTACNSGTTKKEREIASLRADSVSHLRDELFEQAMQATQFVNEINKELAKARSLTTASTKSIQPTAELADLNEERNQVLARVTQLVERLGGLQGRISGLRKEIADKDSAFALRVAEYEKVFEQTSLAVEKQRAELQDVIDGQTVKIASLSKQVDTLTGEVTQLTKEQNAAYFVVGTKAELVKKGILVAEGTKRFLVAGPRTLVPARELDPTVFVKIDRLSDSTIFLPEGEYKIVSRQNAAYASPSSLTGGRIAGALKIEQPERFWNTSRYLIIVRS